MRPDADRDPDATQAPSGPPSPSPSPAPPPTAGGDAAWRRPTVLPAERPTAVVGSATPSTRLPRAAQLLAPGNRVAGHVIVRELGRGGMGAVYLARHEGLQRDVALKVVLAPTPRVRERFLREARAAARLRHPGIVAVHDVGEVQNLPYMAMDLVEGQSLGDRIDASGPLEPREAARLLAQVAHALAHAHEEGVLHRDLKPANVLLTRDGRPLLTDFGLARDLREEEEKRLTMTGELMGTPAFMAPEQALGASKGADARTDVYGLGATLYAALTGEPPFRSESVFMLLARVQRDAPAPPSARRPGVPRALDAVCLKALEKDPARRHASARELARDLERAVGDPGDALAATSRAPRRLVAAGAAAPFVLAAALAGWAAGAARGPSPVAEPGPSPAAGTTTEPPAPPAPAPTTSSSEAPPPAADDDGRDEAWTWVERRPATPPRTRVGVEAACVYDKGRGLVVFAGGHVNDEVGLVDEIWGWDGDDWMCLGLFPGEHRYSHAMVYDTRRSQLVIFGGEGGGRGQLLGDLWAGDGTRWAQLGAGGPRPRRWHAMAYAPDRESVLLYGGAAGGEDLDDLWEWDGARWREHDGPRPAARRAAALTYDTHRGVLVVFGGARGDTRLDELWEWDDRGWRQRPAGPGARSSPALAFDGRRVVLFGGAAAPTPSSPRFTPLDDTWTWDGQRWRALEPAARATPRCRAAMAWDPVRRVVVLFGGARPRENLGDTWELRRAP